MHLKNRVLENFDDQTSGTCEMLRVTSTFMYSESIHNEEAVSVSQYV